MTSRTSPPTTSKRLAAAAVVAVLFVGAIAVMQSNRELPKPAAPASAGDPEAVVARMITAQKRGDVADYLACLGGESAQQAAAKFASLADETAAGQLQASAVELTGHVTNDLQFPEPNVATLVLERIYRDHNERARLTLEKRDGAWRVVARRPLDSYAPDIPYGTPVFVPPDDAEESRQ